jgi:prepilin-type N-terminal cleavage/methylation domain-containing protein
MTHSCNGPRPRAAFTLVEMLVVLTIILVLAALSVTLIPTVGEKQRVGNGAGQLQSWLSIARQWALRDQVPTGVRLLLPTQPLVNQPGFVLATQVQYIQQPDPFTGGYVTITLGTPQGAPLIPPAAQSFTLTAAPVPGQNAPDFWGGFGPATNNPFIKTQWAVQIGDHVEISGCSWVFIVAADPQPNPNNPNASNTLYLVGCVPGQQITITPPNPPLPPVVPLTPDYKIIRQPRPKAGESILSLPDNVAIDLTTNGQYPWYGNPLPQNPYTGSLDILFGPNGSVYNSTGNDMIQLWLRDTNEDLLGQAPPTPPQQPTPGTPYFATFTGEQALVTIYVRTGMIAGNRVDPTPDPSPQPPWTNAVRYRHPYSYTTDGGPSGL